MGRTSSVLAVAGAAAVAASPALYKSLRETLSLPSEAISSLRRSLSRPTPQPFGEKIVGSRTPSGSIMTNVRPVERRFAEMRLPSGGIVVVIPEGMRIIFKGNPYLSVAQQKGDTVRVPGGTVVRMTDRSLELVESAAEHAYHDKNYVVVFSDKLYRPDSGSVINFKDCPGLAPKGTVFEILPQKQKAPTDAGDLLSVVSPDLQPDYVHGRLMQSPKAA